MSDHPHNVAVFEDRLILEARPPITDAEIAAVEARCEGPIPPGLLALWKLSFGGRLDYSLSVTFGDFVHSCSFTELFYPGSDGYNDLWGWIEREAEMAEEAADERGETWSGKLPYLPFGGFEYLERLYVCTRPGPDYGSVIVYAQGLPPAWTLRLHESSVARIADDVPALFRMLDLEKDPATLGPKDYDAGQEMWRAVEDIAQTDPVEGERLKALARSATVDWRAALDMGRLAVVPRARRLALQAASAAGDIPLFQRLVAAGCDLNEAFGGGGNSLDHALVHGQIEAARWLAAQGVDVTNAATNGVSQTPSDLLADFLARGATPSGIAAATAARANRLDNAVLITEALAEDDPESVRELIPTLARWADDSENSASRIEAGTLGSNKDASDYRAEAQRLRTLREHCIARVGAPPPEGSSGGKPSLWRRLTGRA